MGAFKNEQRITEIRFSQNIQNYCTLGSDWYTNQLSVTMIPRDIIPDYCEIDDFTRSLGGKEMIIEDVIDAVYTYLAENYKPLELYVESYVEDAKHMPVTVTKDSARL